LYWAGGAAGIRLENNTALRGPNRGIYARISIQEHSSLSKDKI